MILITVPSRLGTATDYVLMESGYDHPPHCLLLTNGYLTQSVHLLEGIPLLHRTLLAKCLYAAPERAAEYDTVKNDPAAL